LGRAGSTKSRSYTRETLIVAPFIAFFVLAGLFWAIENRWAARPDQPRWRKDSRTDLFYWFFTPFVTKTISKGAAIVAVVVVAVVTGTKLEPGAGLEPFHAGSWITSQPLWLQGVMLLVALDFLGYWVHRLFHRGRLWPFHAVHHSSRQLDWLASVRVHPVNDALGGILRAVPLLLLGFNPTVLAALFPIFALYGLLLHANVPWTFGPLRYVIASPAFHRWHHTSDRQGLNKNFSGLFPVFDILFGTFHMPRHHQPSGFGVTDRVPDGLWRQLVWPFRSESARERSA
jgi:sterol desaturase/sphingolipid hydroxylase (fatty acid hydroxylase superfamily)